MSIPVSVLLYTLLYFILGFEIINSLKESPNKTKVQKLFGIIGWPWIILIKFVLRIFGEKCE